MCQWSQLKEQQKSVCQYQTYQPRIFTYIYFRDYKMKPIGLLIERFGVIAIEEWLKGQRDLLANYT